MFTDVMGTIVKTPEILKDLLVQLRAEGKRIVSTNGCFDLLHRGHVHILREAKQQGDILIVGLNSDVSVRKNKGGSRPILPEHERAELLCSLEMVDFVYLFDEKDCVEFVRLVAPDVHANDASYGENCIESGAVKDCGGRLHLVSKIQAPSTTNIINKIQTLPESA